MKALRGDWVRFSWYERVLALLDLALNPKAVDWPFVIGPADPSRFPRHYFIVKKVPHDEFGNYKYLCIRWN